jgi:hypothetical protein
VDASVTAIRPTEERATANQRAAVCFGFVLIIIFGIIIKLFSIGIINIIIINIIVINIIYIYILLLLSYHVIWGPQMVNKITARTT